MKKPFKKITALLLSALMTVGSGTFAASAANADPYAVSSGEQENEDNYAFPEEMPTTAIPDELPDGSYSVPVYMYVSNRDTASMGNGALTHTATLTMNSGVATAHLSFHDMPFLDTSGHLEKLWIYQPSGADGKDEKTEVNADKTESVTVGNESVNTLRECSFIMPSANNVVRCCVRIDAMGDNEQDARLVFDFSALAENAVQKSTPDEGTYNLSAKAITASTYGSDEEKNLRLAVSSTPTSS